jgi:hypothetical protein
MILYEIVLWDIRMRFIQPFYTWQKILFFVMNCYLNFPDEDLLWPSPTDLLMIDATAERKFYWLLASDVSGS